MEERTTAERVIFATLDVLLVAGAILGVLTIDRGRWITSMPAFYESPGLPLDASVSDREAPAAIGPGGAASGIAQAGGGCLPRSQLMGSPWYETYLYLGAYQAAVGDDDRLKGEAVAMVDCDKEDDPLRGYIR